MATAKKQGDKPASVRLPPTKRQAARISNRAAIFQRALPVVAQLPAFDGTYSDVLGAALADMIADGATLDNISTLPNMPPLRVLLRWVGSAEHPFRKLYYDAKELMVALYEERALTAATQVLRNTIKTRRQVLNDDDDIITLEEERDVDNVERSKLMLNAYQWTLTHLAPKKHSQRLRTTADSAANQLEALFQGLKEGSTE